MLAAVEGRPGDAAGVLSLEEERLGFAILESEDLAVATDVELTLSTRSGQYIHRCQYKVPFHLQNDISTRPQADVHRRCQRKLLGQTSHRSLARPHQEIEKIAGLHTFPG